MFHLITETKIPGLTSLIPRLGGRIMVQDPESRDWNPLSHGLVKVQDVSVLTNKKWNATCNKNSYIGNKNNYLCS